jgi:hypothetical protein
VKPDEGMKMSVKSAESQVENASDEMMNELLEETKPHFEAIHTIVNKFKQEHRFIAVGYNFLFELRDGLNRRKGGVKLSNSKQRKALVKYREFLEAKAEKAA